MAVAGLVSLMVTWWSSPLDRVDTWTSFTSFDQRDIVPIGFAAFAFALGVTAGVLIRRTLPAMATTLVVFVATRVLVNHFVVPRLLTPTVRHYPLELGSTVPGFGSLNGGAFNLIAGSPNLPNDWVFSTVIADKAGNPIRPQYLSRVCPQLGLPPSPPPGPGRSTAVNAIPSPARATSALQECITKVGTSFHDVVTFQPGSHYWPLQWYEMAVYVGAACVLGAVSLWWVRRRIA